VPCPTFSFSDGIWNVGTKKDYSVISLDRILRILTLMVDSLPSGGSSHTRW
jgi:hypothetical protein